MKKLKLIFTIFLLIIGQTILACDCNSKGKFLKVAPDTELVALIKVSKYLTFKDIYNEKTPMSMEVEIIEIYKGKESKKTVVVWGDSGILCRPYLSRFDVGKFYVIAFDKGMDGSKGFGHENEKITDYSISICGDYWLNVDIHNQKALGAVSFWQSQISLGNLKMKFSKK